MGKRVSFIISQVERELLLGIIRRGENRRARQRAQTLIYLDDGQSMSEAAAMVGVNVRTVGSTRTAWLDCGEQSLYDAPRCGAPHKLNSLDLQRIMALAADQPLTANAVLALHVDAGGPPVHVATLTSALKTAGFVWKRTRASLKKKK